MAYRRRGGGAVHVAFFTRWKNLEYHAGMHPRPSRAVALLPLLALCPSVFAQAAPPPSATRPVGPPSPSIPFPPGVPLVTRVYSIRYGTALEMARIVADLVPGVKVVLGPQPKYIRDTTSGEALGVDVSSRAAPLRLAPEPPPTNVEDQFVRFLVLRGPEAEVKAALEVLAQIDLAAPQVLIEAKIVDMSEGAAAQLGVSWDFAPSGTTAQFKLSPPASPDGDAPWPQVVFGRLTRDLVRFNAALDAAIQRNEARLLASPRLIALYNKRARIFIGDEVTYLVGAVASQNGPTLETGKVSVGVELNVVATANGDGTIDLKVNPEIGSLLQLTTLANGVSLPRISRRTLSTSVRLRDGETLALGGLISESEIKAIRKVPLVGDLPVLGSLFRREVRDKSRSEVVIFLRASIVRDDAWPPPGVEAKPALPPEPQPAPESGVEPVRR